MINEKNKSMVAGFIKIGWKFKGKLHKENRRLSL